jgi:hypothetical protein
MAKRLDKVVAVLKSLSDDDRRFVMGQFTTLTRYEIGANRFVLVDDGIIHIIEESTNKGAQFTEPRWINLVGNFGDIDTAISQLETSASFNLHIGGGWYVSVNKGFICVDIRKFYFKNGQVKPSTNGIALRLDEWKKVKEVAELMFNKNPGLRSVEPCYIRADHYNQLGAMSCLECNPFQ